MTKLYYTSAHNAAAFAAAFIAGIELECESLETPKEVESLEAKEGKEQPPEQPAEESAKETEPCLIHDGNKFFIEGVILGVLSEKGPGAKLAPAAGSIARYHVHQWIADVSLKIAAILDELQQPQIPEDVKAYLEDRLSANMEAIEADFTRCERAFAVGDRFSIADIYTHFIMKRVCAMANVAEEEEEEEEEEEQAEPAPSGTAAATAEQPVEEISAGTGGKINMEHFPMLKKYCHAISQREDIRAAENRMQCIPATTVEKIPSKCLPFCPWSLSTTAAAGATTTAN